MAKDNYKPVDNTPDPVQTAPSNRALRMTFSYEGDQVSLVSQQRVEMILPRSHPLEGYEDRTGFWFTVHNSEDRPVYRRVIESPMRHDTEVFAPEGETSVRRQPVETPKGSFTILIPEVEGEQSVAFSSHPLKPDARHLRAAEIARFKVTKER